MGRDRQKPQVNMFRRKRRRALFHTSDETGLFHAKPEGVPAQIQEKDVK